MNVDTPCAARVASNSVKACAHLNGFSHQHRNLLYSRFFRRTDVVSLLVAMSRSFLPRLVHNVGRRLESMGVIRLPLEPREIMEEAKRRTGLTDFGGMEFLEPLNRLVTSCRDEANLNVLGRMAARREMIQLLENRLLITEERRINPAIAKTRIERPLFILGLPRSGTTFLHSLLAQDPASRAPLTWEVMFPSNQTGSRRRRIARARRNLDIFAKLSPGFEAIHQMDALLPQECIAMMSHAFLSDEFDNMFNIPSYTSWLQTQSFAPAYDWHRRFLQHLQKGVNERWVLKAPAHLASFLSLLDTYPDACFIQTHRAPVEVMRSLTNMTSVLQSTFSDTPMPEPTEPELVRYWADTLNKFNRDRELLDPGRICDVQFTEIRQDPIAVVCKIYAHFGKTLSFRAKQRMQDFSDRNRRKKPTSKSDLILSAPFHSADDRFFAEYSERYRV